MIRTFLPAQALRTSKKTGGLNSRPSCVSDAVCYAVPRRARSLSLRSRLVVSRFGRATRASVRPFQLAWYVVRAKHGPLVPQPSRDDVARETSPSFSCGTLCYMHGPAHRGSSPRPSPWLRPSANVSRPEAPFLRCTRPVGGPTTTTNGNVSHLKERLCLPGLSRRRGVTSRTRDPSEKHNSAPDAFGLAVRH